jgi:cyclopropane-fatty-acyl-phospholipid synthase
MERRRSSSRTVADAVERIVGPDLPIAIETYDGGRIGPADAPATLVIRSPDAVRRILTAPGELGIGRAYVAGDLEVEGDIYAALASLRERLPRVRLGPPQLVALARLVGPDGLRPLPPPPEEAWLRGRRHSKGRDAQAIAHHYDVSNRFFELVLGPSMTYSCAVWPRTDATLEEAQAAKYELICRKLELGEGMRLLDMGCGWGGMAMHAARHHGASVVGVTLSRRQVEWPRRRWPTPAWPTGWRSASRTTGTSSTAHSMQSPRSACSSTRASGTSGCTSGGCTACSAREAGC